MSDGTRPDAANNATNGAKNSESASPDVTTADKAENAPETQSGSNTDVFPRSYVEELRRESAGYRDRAKTAEERADALAKRLHRELVKATGRLENPDDLPFDADHLDDADKLAEAIETLLNDRPYLAKRKVKGDVGQGQRGGNAATPTFADLFSA